MLEIVRNEKNRNLLNGVFVKEFSYEVITESEYYVSSKKLLIDSFSFDEIFYKTGFKNESDDYFVMPCGFSSWFSKPELMPERKFRKRIFDFLTDEPKKNCVEGYFLSYLRFQKEDIEKSEYFVMASCGDDTPPVVYEIDRKNRKIDIFISSQNKTFHDGEIIAEIDFFKVEGYFEFQKSVHEIYYDERFDEINFLDDLAKPGIIDFEGECRFFSGGFCFSKDYQKVLNEKSILECAEMLSSNKNFVNQFFILNNRKRIFLLEDGWQNFTGDWRVSREAFPSGLPSLVNQIEEKGFIFGLWTAPFVCNARSSVFNEHPSWILRKKNGKPVTILSEGRTFGKKSLLYCLDLTDEEVLEYIDSVMETVINEWNVRFVWLDFLFAGFAHGCFKNVKSPYEVYLNALKLVTRRKENRNHQKVAYLGSGEIFELSYKYLPLSKTGVSVLPEWNDSFFTRNDFYSGRSVLKSLRTALSHSFWHQSVFCNDIDVIFFRNDSMLLSEDEKELIILVSYMFSGHLMTEDSPVKFCDRTDIVFVQELLRYMNLLKSENFADYQIVEDVFLFVSESKKFSGIINLMDKDFPALEIDEKYIQSWFSKSSETVIGHYLYRKNHLYFKRHTVSLFRRTVF